MYKIESSKDIKKLIRSILELVLLLSLLAFILKSLLTSTTYRPYNPLDTNVVSWIPGYFIFRCGEGRKQFENRSGQA